MVSIDIHRILPGCLQDDCHKNNEEASATHNNICFRYCHESKPNNSLHQIAQKKTHRNSTKGSPIQKEGHIIDSPTKGKPEGTFVVVLRYIFHLEGGKVRPRWWVVVVGMMALFAVNHNGSRRGVFLFGKFLFGFEHGHRSRRHGAEQGGAHGRHRAKRGGR